MSFSCYVYYRVRADLSREANDAADGIIETLAQHCEFTPRLMTKVGEPSLWMEVYEGILDKERFLDTMRARVQEAGFERYLQSDGERHVEFFQCA